MACRVSRVERTSNKGKFDLSQRVGGGTTATFNAWPLSSDESPPRRLLIDTRIVAMSSFVPAVEDVHQSQTPEYLNPTT
jgi:hypothetical protein